MRVLVAAGASANCHPCMDRHLARCDELDIHRAELIAAVEVGLMVHRGAEKAIRKKTLELLGETAVKAWCPQISPTSSNHRRERDGR